VQECSDTRESLPKDESLLKEIEQAEMKWKVELWRLCNMIAEWTTVCESERSKDIGETKETRDTGESEEQEFQNVEGKSTENCKQKRRLFPLLLHLPSPKLWNTLVRICDHSTGNSQELYDGKQGRIEDKHVDNTNPIVKVQITLVKVNAQS
tara:strand:- start:12 stop:467 length:456 start_codon:yes stop_codon:yes gene_type:complete